MQKNNIAILSTGLLDKEIVDQAYDLDVVVEVLPFIETKPVAASALRKVVEPLIGQHTFIIITSQNAVEALAAAVDITPVSWTFFCIEETTANKIKKYFGASSIAASAQNASGLVKRIIEWGITDEMIFFCGDQRRDELPDQLRSSGIAIREVITYETVATPQKLTKDYEGILFFSPSAVRSFFSLNQAAPETVLFTIGSTTAEALQSFTKNKIVIADKPDKEEVVNKAIEYFKQ
jgi:uroporphyrinogen-III synthase